MAGYTQLVQRGGLRSNASAPGLVLAMVLLSLAMNMGCSRSPDDPRNLIEAAPIRVEAEQVMLTSPEVDCGVRSELWGPPTDPNQGRSVCPLMPAGRALRFDDDVVYTEPGQQSAYVQIRGRFPLTILEMVSANDGPESNTKLVTSRVGVRLDNPCFPNPLPIMGVRKGQFNQEEPPVMLFRLNGDWQLEKFVH